MGEAKTYLLIDGENIDWAIGSILDRKPAPAERPRWQRLVEFVGSHWDQPVQALFFLNATKGAPMTFVQALMAMDYKPILLRGSADEKVVDIGIQKMLQAIADSGGDVMLGSHDADFAHDLEAVAAQGHRVAVVGFPELLSHELRAIPGLEILDLETDTKSFSEPLPRIRIISLSEFDPTLYL